MKNTGRIPWISEAGALFSMLRQEVCSYLLLCLQALSHWTGWNCAGSYAQAQPFFAAQSNLKLNTMPNLPCCNQDQNFSANLNSHYTGDYQSTGATENNQFMTDELFQIWSCAIADNLNTLQQ